MSERQCNRVNPKPARRARMPWRSKMKKALSVVLTVDPILPRFAETA
jgi:hypothetical protein